MRLTTAYFLSVDDHRDGETLIKATTRAAMMWAKREGRTRDAKFSSALTSGPATFLGALDHRIKLDNEYSNYRGRQEEIYR